MSPWHLSYLTSLTSLFPLLSLSVLLLFILDEDKHRCHRPAK